MWYNTGDFTNDNGDCCLGQPNNPDSQIFGFICLFWDVCHCLPQFKNSSDLSKSEL